MLSGTRRARHGSSRDACGDDIVGCRRGRRQRESSEQESRPQQQQQRRKLRGGRAEEAARRRGVRLLRLVYVGGVAGIGLVVLQVASSSAPAGAPHWKNAPLNTPAALKEVKGGAFEPSSSAEGEADIGGSRQDTGTGHGSVVAVRDSLHGKWRRRLVTTSDGEDRDMLGGLAEDEEANAAACADNNFSGGGAGKVVLLVIAILFTFNGLAIVCDEFFQASLEKISEVSECESDETKQPLCTCLSVNTTEVDEVYDMNSACAVHAEGICLYKTSLALR